MAEDETPSRCEFLAHGRWANDGEIGRVVMFSQWYGVLCYCESNTLSLRFRNL
jgi:hypothetical protein